MKRENSNLVLWLVLAVPVAWVAAVLADLLELGAGLEGSMERVSMLLSSPLAISFNQRTLPLIFFTLVVYGFAIYIHQVEQGKKRTGEEHGSAVWGKAAAINGKYMDHKHKEKNVILTDSIQMGLDGRKHRRNLNTLVVGGSGAGKTLFYAKPNIMQCNSSYPALFTSLRIELASVPEGIQRYEIRHEDDNGMAAAQVARGIMVNHMGTLLMRSELPLDEHGYLDIEDRDLVFTNSGIRELDEYMRQYPQPGKLLDATNQTQAGNPQYPLCQYTSSVSILDSRVSTGGKYRGPVLAALPQMPVTNRISDVKAFIRDKKDDAYFE